MGSQRFFDGLGIRAVYAAGFIDGRLDGFHQPFQVLGFLADKDTGIDINKISSGFGLIFGDLCYAFLVLFFNGRAITFLLALISSPTINIVGSY